MKNNHPPSPPKWIDSLLEFLYHPPLLEHIQGDLHELYHRDLQNQGKLVAKSKYLFYVLDHLRPSMLGANNIVALLKNYIKVSARFHKSNWGYSLLSVLGLSFALGFCLLAYSYIINEVFYDKFHHDHERIYRVAVTANFSGPETWEMTPPPLALAIKNTIPEVEATTRLIKVNALEVDKENELWESSVSMVSADFFKIFRFPLQNGQSPTVLEPNTALITKSTADKYFPSEDPLGSTISIGNGNANMRFKVTGVLMDAPSNSSIQFQVVIPDHHLAHFYGDDAETNWRGIKSGVVTFLKLKPGASIKDLQNKLNKIADNHGLSEFLRSTDLSHKLPIAKMASLHFNNDTNLRLLEPPGNKTLVIIFSMASIAVFLLALFNFINFSLGLLSNRTREVGLRKVMGANPTAVVFQSIIDSGMLVLTAIILAVVLAQAALPYFNTLLNQVLVIDLLDLVILPTLGLLFVFAVLFTAAYPGFLMASNKSVALIESSRQLGKQGLLSNILLTTQFAIALLFLSGWMIANAQLAKMDSHQLGYNPSSVLYQEFEIRSALDDKEVEQLRNAILPLAAVDGVTSSRGAIFGDSPGSMWRLRFQDETINVAAIKVDYDFLDVMEIDLIEGRNFEKANEADGQGAVIVNQAFLEKFEITDALGKTPAIFGDNGPSIVGIVGDYHFQSLRKEVEPLILNLRPNSKNSAIFVRVNRDDLPTTMASIASSWGELFPNRGLDLKFLNEHISRQYQQETTLLTAIKYASFLAIILAISGLVGLLSLALRSNQKDISLRQVLGAGLPQLYQTYGFRYLLIITIAAPFAIAGSWLFYKTWSQSFYINTNFEVGFIVVPILVVGGLSIMLSGIQVFKISRANPSQVLGEE